MSVQETKQICVAAELQHLATRLVTAELPELPMLLTYHQLSMNRFQETFLLLEGLNAVDWIQFHFLA
jgi:hypothetical protein